MDVVLIVCLVTLWIALLQGDTKVNFWYLEYICRAYVYVNFDFFSVLDLQVTLVINGLFDCGLPWWRPVTLVIFLSPVLWSTHKGCTGTDFLYSSQCKCLSRDTVLWSCKGTGVQHEPPLYGFHHYSLQYLPFYRANVQAKTHEYM